MNVRRGPSLIESFNVAFEGIIHVLRTQRNMRIHFSIAAAVLVAAVAVGVDRVELIALLLAIGFVLIAEMINTAIEAGIDVSTTAFDPLAKLAKDIAAGAVLIATVNAVAIGYLVFSDRTRGVDGPCAADFPRGMRRSRSGAGWRRRTSWATPATGS
jgi:diacylglycerol kinase (ATP)